MNFDIATDQFSRDLIRELAESDDGLRFLKLRSLSRREHLIELFDKASITPQANSARGMFREAFESTAVDEKIIDQTISQIYASEREERRANEPELVNQLYRLDVFDWGGLHQNSLERTIVDNYVKKIRDYDQLSSCIEHELHHSMRGYVLCSWYNHWTSILIEDIFRDHAAVVPAVGLIKKIDFFLNGVPFDLKVTYLPEGFIKDCRRKDSRRPELTLLKQWARRNEVPFSTDLPDARLLSDLWYKASDDPTRDGRQVLAELMAFRHKLIQDVQADPYRLIRWLYENQGVRRFDASNRLFVVLIDSANFFDSWKLKRAKPLLDSEITRFLNNGQSPPGRTLEFNWQGSTYTAVSDALIITKPKGLQM